MPYKRWKRAEEKQLIEEFKRAGCSREAIPKLAKRFNRSEEAILKKLQRLGLNVVGAKFEMTTTIEQVKDLPSLQEVLKIVAGALKKATEPGLGKTELQRLDTIATLYKAYVDGLERFVRYREIEAKLEELEEKYRELAEEKAKSDASKRNSAKMV
jgi:hypothetical protein